MSHSDEGWIYYSFTNPATNQWQLKVTFVKRGHILRGSGADRRRQLPGLKRAARKWTDFCRLGPVGCSRRKPLSAFAGSIGFARAGLACIPFAIADLILAATGFLA